MAESVLPGDFPLPPDLQGFWEWDRMHFPRPQTPVTEEILFPAVSQGFSMGMDEFAHPMALVCRVINYYGYIGMVPHDLKGETMEQRVARFKETAMRMVPQVGPLWEKEWLPSVLPLIEKARTLDYGTLSDTGLLDSFEELRKDLLYCWYVHGKINFSNVAASWFVDFYNEEFQPEDPTEAYDALQGFPTTSVEAGRGLWKLRQTVMNSPRLMEDFQNTDAARLPETLERSEEGRRFLQQLRVYLDEFGWRNDAFEIAEPTWRENPTIPLNALQGYIRVGEAGDPDVRFKAAVARREVLLARARARLAGDPEKLARFNQLYEGGRWNLQVTDDHNFHIDQRGLTMMRLPLLEMGRRLVRKGVLEHENDIFMLYQAEVREGMAGRDQRPLAARRKAEMEQWSKLLPPPTLGEPHDPPTDDPFYQAIAVKMFGAGSEPSRDPAVITGIGASAGTARGKAKVAKSLPEASAKIEPGDILVCEMTMPAWTPLFSIAAAVVADTGGVLSHCAIVAREYRMPCVAGTRIGTSVIKDGMVLTVDGSKGIVRIEAGSEGQAE